MYLKFGNSKALYFFSWECTYETSFSIKAASLPTYTHLTQNNFSNQSPPTTSLSKKNLSRLSCNFPLQTLLGNYHVVSFAKQTKKKVTCLGTIHKRHHAKRGRGCLSFFRLRPKSVTEGVLKRICAWCGHAWAVTSYVLI